MLYREQMNRTNGASTNLKNDPSTRDYPNLKISPRPANRIIHVIYCLCFSDALHSRSAAPFYPMSYSMSDFTVHALDRVPFGVS